MRLESITIQVPTKHIEWCFLDFTREDGKGFSGSLVSSRKILERKDMGLKEKFKPLQPIDNSCSLEDMFNEQTANEIKTLEEYIPGINYLVSIDMGYTTYHSSVNHQKHTILIELFNSIDDVFEFLKREQINCVYKGESFAELIKRYSEEREKYTCDYIEHICEQIAVGGQYKGLFVEEVENETGMKECKNVERAEFIFDDGSKLLWQHGSRSDPSLSKVIEVS